jgi:hypothetical protein
MRLKFSWRSVGDSLLPGCSSDLVDADGISVLCSVLMDDGGLSVKTAREAIRDGLEKIDAVRTGATDVAFWEREEWGVEIKPSLVRIYTLAHDSENSTMETETFRNALTGWQDFLSNTPDATVVREIEI